MKIHIHFFDMKTEIRMKIYIQEYLKNLNF